MKIVFIKPRYFDKESRTIWRCVMPPMGLTSLAGMLLSRGYRDVKILDMEALEYGYDDMAAYLKRERPHIIGVDLRTQLINRTRHITKLAKELFPESTVLVGGPHTFLYMQDTINEVPHADFAFRGEAEYTLPEFLKIWESGRPDWEALKRIDGLCFKHDGQQHVSQVVPRIQDLDALPIPAHELLPLDGYSDLFVSYNKMHAVMTTRGCPFHCSFCTEPIIYGHKVREHSPDYVGEELDKLINHFGIDYIMFHDATFNYSKKRVMEICDVILKRGLKFQWKIKARVDCVDREMLRTMKRAGCRVMGYGVEAGTDKALIELRKDYTIEQVRRAFELTQEEGLDILAYFLVGTYGETVEDVKQTIRFSIDLRPNWVHYMTTTPIPGSELYEKVKARGDFRTTEWSDFYFYTATYKTDLLSPQKIYTLYKLAYKKFYLRPSYIVREFFRLRCFGDFWVRFRAGITLLKNMLLGRYGSFN